MGQQQYPVTVLMPAYNAGPYIREAIDSVLQQTYTDFEFLIINDGSKDETLSIIRSYNDQRIRLIDQANKGLIDSLNDGIKLSQGSIIARMDADDVCLPNRLAVQMEYLKRNPEYIAVGSEADVMDKEGNYLLRLTPIAHTNEEVVERIDLKCPFIHPCVAFRKDAVLQVGGYPKNALTFEDHLLWKELLTVGKVCNLKDVLLKVRFNPESVTIDEKWRGEAFIEIRKRSVHNGFVSNEDAIELKEIVSKQNFSEYKHASYFAMVGKKYLWDNPNAQLARSHFAKAIKLYPKNKELYMLWLMTFLPSVIVNKIYTSFKKR
ncbi:MAG: glycosyltransferase [Bacteroidota bacterium]